MPVVLQGFSILLEVEVGIAQLAVDGAEGLQVFRTDLDGRLKKRRPAFEVAGLAQTFPFQSQLQAGGLHPKHRGFHKQTDEPNGDKAALQPVSRGSAETAAPHSS